METKDWIYVIGLILTSFVSGWALKINIKNRKNAIREQLYKEQLSFFLKLMSEFAIINAKFNRIVMHHKDDSDDELRLNYKRIHEVSLLYFSNSLLLPNELSILIYKTMISASKFNNLLKSKEVETTKTEYHKFIHLLTNMEDEIRIFLGVGALTKENRDIIGKSE